MKKFARLAAVAVLVLSTLNVPSPAGVPDPKCPPDYPGCTPVR